MLIKQYLGNVKPIIMTIEEYRFFLLLQEARVADLIERRKEKLEFIGDDFYIDIVASIILSSNIDKLLEPLKNIKKIDNESEAVILKTHKDITELFKKISGLHKRSLASKYFHFHFQNLFFIYDTRAVNAASKLSNITKIPINITNNFDKEYQIFVGKYLDIRML